MRTSASNDHNKSANDDEMKQIVETFDVIDEEIITTAKKKRTVDKKLTDFPLITMKKKKMTVDKKLTDFPLITVKKNNNATTATKQIHKRKSITVDSDASYSSDEDQKKSAETPKKKEESTNIKTNNNSTHIKTSNNSDEADTQTKVNYR